MLCFRNQMFHCHKEVYSCPHLSNVKEEEVENRQQAVYTLHIHFLQAI